MTGHISDHRPGGDLVARPDTGSMYTLTSTWAPSGAFPAGDTLVQPFASLDVAINSGLHLSCCAGVRSVRVSEGDTVHCEYDRQDNIWNSRTPEARRYAKTGSASDDDAAWVDDSGAEILRLPNQ